MKIRALALLAVAGVASVANAQAVETITYSIEWASASIAPGGSNTGAVYATITPDIGTVTKWNTPPGNGTKDGIVKAFASSIINLLNSQNGTHGNLAWTVPTEFGLAGLPGTPDGSGGILSSQAGQFGPPANPNPNVGQKVKVLDLSWSNAANLNAVYNVEFATKAASAKVFLDVGLAAWVGENAVKVDGKGGFQVTPAPASLALLGLGGLVAGRRRR